MSNNKERYNKLKDIDLESIVLKSDQGGEVDLLGKCKHISIHEDLFQNFTSGYVRVVDAHNLVMHFPIIGQETITIRYKTPGFNKKTVEMSFDVYSIEGRQKSDTMKSEVYDIRFISRGYRVLKQNVVDGAYTGEISKMVGDIFSENMPNESLSVLKTAGEYKFVMTGNTVLDTIEWLSARSVSEESPNNSDYIFFQNSIGYHFMPVSSLASQPPSYSYEAIPTSTNQDPQSSGNLYKQFYNIEDFSIPKQFNRLEEMESGVYSSNIMIHDVINKRVIRNISTYIEDWENSSHCEKYPSLPLKNRFSTKPDSYEVIRSRHEGLHDEYPNVQDYEQWLLKRVKSMGGFDSMKMEITVPGNSDIKVGETINVRIPSSEPLKKQDSDWFDKYLSGKYLITAVRHYIDIFESRDYTTILELSRDSVPERVPDKSTFLGSGQGDSSNNEGVFR